MKKLVLILLSGMFAAACGESHTYKGSITRTDMFQTKSDVSITITKESDTAATMVVKGSGDTIFEKCMYPIKLEKESSGWNPTNCYLKTDFGSDSRMVTGIIEIDGKIMKWDGAAYNSTDHSTMKYEFMGKED